MSAFGDYLRLHREATGISQRRLAAQVGIDFSYLSKLELGVIRAPSDAVIAAIAPLIGLTVGELRDMAPKPPDFWEQGDVLEDNPALIRVLFLLADQRYPLAVYADLIERLAGYRVEHLQ